MRERSICSPRCARSGRRTPRRPRACRARAGRSSGSRRRRTSPCPTGTSAGPPSPTAARARARRAGAWRSPCRPDAARCAAAGRRSRCRARRTRASAATQLLRGVGQHQRSPRRRAAAFQPSESFASRSRSANGRPSALPTSRIAPRERYVAKLATSDACSRPYFSVTRDDQLLADVAREVEVDVGHRRQLAVEEAAEREVVRDRVDVREAGEVADERADRRAAPAARRQHVAHRAGAAHLVARPRARARAPPSGAGRSRRGRARRSARAPPRAARARAACGR